MRLRSSFLVVACTLGLCAQTPAPPKPSAGAIDTDETIRSETRLVVLHVSVTDKSGTPIPKIPQTAFKVFENNEPQGITLFRREDIPVSLGLIIDDSGSMKDSRQKVEQAALNLVKASKRDDEVFVVNYSDTAFLDVELTGDLKKLEEGVQRRDSRGGTAMRDALSMSLDYMNKEAKKAKRVLLVVTDGEDNASSTTLERLVAQSRQSEVLIYAIGLLNNEDARASRRAKRALQELANATGGLAFFPSTLDEVNQISATVAEELRNQYVVGYNPTNSALDGSFRQIKVTVDNVKGSVRTRTGYYATPSKDIPEGAVSSTGGSGSQN